MTPNSMPLDALLGYVSNSDQDTLREILEHTRQALIEAEAAAVVGAQPHERTEGRVGHRNGRRDADGGHQSGPAGAGAPQAAPGELPTEPVGAPAAD
jgi:transposase-like protein